MTHSDLRAWGSHRACQCISLSRSKCTEQWVCGPTRCRVNAENVLLPGNAQPNVPKNPGMRYSDWLSDYVRVEFFGPSTGDTHVPLSVCLPVRIIGSFLLKKQKVKNCTKSGKYSNHLQGSIHPLPTRSLLFFIVHTRNQHRNEKGL